MAGRIKATKRNSKGQYIVELPLVIFTIVIAVFMPMVNLATVHLRAYVGITCFKSAADAAAKATTFSRDISDREKSALTRTAERLQRELGRVPGITYSDVKTTIIRKSIVDGSTTKFEQPLTPRQINTSDNVYLVEVTGKLAVEPIVRGLEYAVKVPGLNVPIQLNTREIHRIERIGGWTI